MKNNNRFIKIWLFLFSLLIAIALLTPSVEAASYTIITTNTIELASTKLAAFVTHKIDDQGFSVEVITEDEYTSGATCDERANNIRAWLVSNYLSNGIEYVLLIGDPHPTTWDLNTSIPMKMCWPRNNATTDMSYDESPTDMYYACLTGNWDLDGDGKYGEHGTDDGNTDDFGAGGVDRAPEVYVGRIPYYGTIADLDSILQKIIDYPKADANWYKSALLPMSFSDDNTDGAYLAEAIIDDILTPNSSSKYTLYQQGTYVHDSIFVSDAELLDGAVATHWAANDYGFVAWWAHGNETSAGVYGDGTLLQSSDCLSLDDDHPAFVLQISCLNGYPENNGNLGYSLLKQGAIATISASRVSWYAGNGIATPDWFDTWGASIGDNASYAYHMMKKMISEGNTVGEANFWCRENFGLSWTSGASFMNCTDFNIYGDPGASFYPLPTFTITLDTNPASTGTITFHGVSWEDGNTLKRSAADYTITANPGSDYAFSGWEVSGGLSVANSASATTTCTVSGDGTLRMGQGAVGDGAAEDGGKKSKACFIATSAYSRCTDSHGLKSRISTDLKKIEILQKFRDEYLLTNAPGRAFVSFYNRVSPGVADFIRDKEPLKAMVRFELKPLVWIAEKILNLEE